jgi:hypothetical protein
MDKYNCTKCNYITNNSSSYNIHLKSQKHNGIENKTKDMKQYMKDYMKNYYLKNSNDVMCKICGKVIKQYTYYAHMKSKVHMKAENDI